MNKQEFESAFAGILRVDLMFLGWDQTCRTIDIANAGNDLLVSEPAIYLLLANALLYAVLEFLKLKNAIPTALVNDALMRFMTNFV